jgi:DnaK suppressor protein
MLEDTENTQISPDYRPTESEPYMSPLMVAYFRQKLVSWRKELFNDSVQGVRRIQSELPTGAESIDRAGLETIRGEELRRLGNEEWLMFQIDEALERIHNGTYGYCLSTGEPIGIKRLEAWPIAALSAEAQALTEKHMV